jgi:hypothetical protein
LDTHRAGAFCGVDATRDDAASEVRRDHAGRGRD